MRHYNKIEAICLMDDLSTAGKPFVFAVDYASEKAYIEEVGQIDPMEWQYNINGFSNEEVNITNRQTPYLEAFPITFEQYKSGFDHVRKNILAGNSYLVNYTCGTPIKCNLNTRELFHLSKAPYRMWIRGQFVLFSPEIFIRTHKGQISSYPMKGTIDASLKDAEIRLLEDSKERAEHATITDLIRNELSQVAKEVYVNRYRYVERLHTNRGVLLQTSSEIVGTLKDDYRMNIGSLLYGMLPAGSISGAPKASTQQIIAEAENDDRGFYTGVGGCFDGKELDSFVMIRFIEEREGELIFRSGGGITCNSSAEDEYNEMKGKIYVPIY